MGRETGGGVWVSAGPLSALADQDLTIVTLKGQRIALIRRGEQIHALEDRCSHDSASLAGGRLEGDRVVCPRHGAKFDVATGGRPTLPAVRPILALPTKVVDGEVLVSL